MFKLLKQWIMRRVFIRVLSRCWRKWMFSVPLYLQRMCRAINFWLYFSNAALLKITLSGSSNSELIDAMSLYPTLEDLRVENEGLFKQVMISGGHKQMSNHYGKSIWFNQQDNVIALYRVQGLFESYIGLILRIVTFS